MYAYLKMNGYLFCTHVFVTVCLYVCVCDFVHLFGFCVRSGHLSVTIKTKLLVNHTLRSPNLHRNVKLLPYTRKKPIQTQIRNCCVRKYSLRPPLSNYSQIE